MKMTAGQDNIMAQAPSLDEAASKKQEMRRKMQLPIPTMFKTDGPLMLEPVKEEALINDKDKAHNAPHMLDEESAKILRSQFPATMDTPFYKVKPGMDAKTMPKDTPLRMGVVLSGGQAAGGHNVICGIYDYIMSVSKDSQLYGFIGGPHGVYSGIYIQLTREIIDKYRNMGGFDMIKSGRHKIETKEQMEQSMKVCKQLQLQGLVVIGGDDSNTNAAILAEYFKANGCETSVIGCPKTIDGDLKNMFVEISFGFDTACKTYSAEIGSVMAETLTDGDTYSFIRLMGRSASLIALECALRTHPNMTFIGEEVMMKKLSLKQIVDMVVDLVEKRAKAGRSYGVVCLPEGLIEFIPEVSTLIMEVNNMVASGPFDMEKLSAPSKQVMVSLPEETRQQLLLDRDPHGNVQVAMIHTEKLIMDMTAMELKRRQFKGAFKGKCYYFGYEGRSGFPSDFDASYCYALGKCAAVLVRNRATSCMAVMKNMSSGGSAETWMPAGIPLIKMMNLENRKGKANVPVIKKFLVDTDKPCFKAFEMVRDQWALYDFYSMPGSMQFDESKPELPFTLTGPPAMETLVPNQAKAVMMDDTKMMDPRERYFRAFAQLKSSLQSKRLESKLQAPFPPMENGSVLKFDDNAEARFVKSSQEAVLQSLFPMAMSAVQSGKWGTTKVMCQKGATRPSRVGLVLFGKATPGMSNILFAAAEKISSVGGEVYGFHGVKGLFERRYMELHRDTQLVSMQKNMASFPLLGRSPDEESMLMTLEGMEKVYMTLTQMRLDGMILMGAPYLMASAMSEYLLQKNCMTKVVCVAGDMKMNDMTQMCRFVSQLNKQAKMPSFSSMKDDNQIVDASQYFGDMMTQKVGSLSSGVMGLGFDTQTKFASELVGNLLTDSNSATKYFYFCRVGGGVGAEAEVAFQTHPNICVLSADSMKKTPVEIAMDVSTLIAQRCAAKKNFGLMVMNEDFFSKNIALRTAASQLYMNRGDDSRLCDASKAMMSTIGPMYAEKMRKMFDGTGCFYTKMQEFPVLDMMAKMVSIRFDDMVSKKQVAGSFSPVCFDLVVPARGAMPTSMDCCYGSALGYFTGALFSAMDMKDRIVGGCALMVNNLMSSMSLWQSSIVPLPVAASMVRMTEKQMQQQTEMEFTDDTTKHGMPNSIMDIMAKAVMQKWLLDDMYINNGPVQFSKMEMPEADAASNFMMRMLTL